MGRDPDGEYAEYVSARLPRLHRTAYLMCGDADRADDLVQATLLALYVHWRRARTADNLDGYVHRIMARRFVDEKRRPWSRVFLRDSVPERAVPADDSFDDRDRVVRALRTVPPGQRTVLVLRYFADLSVEATAQALGLSPGTVKSQCSRGLAALREELGLAGTVGSAERVGGTP